MSYGWFADSGTSVSSASSSRSTGSVVSRRGGSSTLLPGRYDEQLADEQQALAVVGHGEVGDAALRVVRHRAAELLLRHVLVRDRLDDVRPGHEHVARALHHHREVGDGRRVDGAAGARPHDGRDLRDDARGERVAQEDVGVARQRHHAFLDPRAARVVEADHRRALPHRQVHDLHDLRGVGLRQRPAEHGEVLREGVDDAPVDAAEARHDAVAGNHLVLHPEVAAAVDDQLVDLLERPRVEQQFHPLPRGQLAGLVLALEARLAAAQFGRLLQLGQLLAFVHALTWRTPVPSRPAASGICDARAASRREAAGCRDVHGAWNRMMFAMLRFGLRNDRRSLALFRPIRPRPSR